MKNKILVALVWLVLGIPAILFLKGCESAQPLPPEPESKWPPRQKPIEPPKRFA